MSMTARRSRHPVLAFAGLLVLVGLASVTIPRPLQPAVQAQGAPGLPVEALTDLEQLRARFNGDVGKVRLILLLSPT